MSVKPVQADAAQDPLRIPLPARVAAPDVPALHACLLEAIEAGRSVVIDGHAVERVDSAAAQWLIVCHASSRAEGAANVNGPTLEASAALQRALGMAGLTLVPELAA